jgi:hypothetical protein
MRCPNCNAENPGTAQFCSLCLTSFKPEVKEAPPLPTVEEKPKSRAVGWTCSVCQTINVVEDDVCVACGSSLFESLKRAETMDERRTFEGKNAYVAAGLSFMPGLGHFYLGLAGEGIIRIILFAWWFGFVLILPDRSGPMGGVRVILLVASIALILISAIDSYRSIEEPGSVPILSRKVILYSSLTVVGLLVAGAFSSVVAARS